MKLRNSKDPVLYLRDPDGLPKNLRRGMLDGLSQLNQQRFTDTGDPEIATRIQQYEMAYRMQTSVPELTDLRDETEEVFELYGPDSRRPGSYAANCILARRLASEACALFSCSIQTGIIIVVSPPGARPDAATPTSPVLL